MMGAGMRLQKMRKSFLLLFLVSCFITILNGYSWSVVLVLGFACRSQCRLSIFMSLEPFNLYYPCSCFTFPLFHCDQQIVQAFTLFSIFAALGGFERGLYVEKWAPFVKVSFYLVLTDVMMGYLTVSVMSRKLH